MYYFPFTLYFYSLPLSFEGEGDTGGEVATPLSNLPVLISQITA